MFHIRFITPRTPQNCGARTHRGSRASIVKGGLLILCALMIVGFLSCMAVNGFVKSCAQRQITTIEDLGKQEGMADAVLVLGAQVKADGTPSKMLRERLDTGIEVYKAGLTDRMIMSGDHGRKDYDEVNTMKNYAIEQGVPAEHIFMDHAGFSTYESMYRAKEIFQADKVIVVTQKYHLYRAVYDAEAMGIDAWGIPCDTRVYSGDRYRKFREVLARMKDVGYTMIKPAPACLGAAIPVSGNGNATNDL